MIKVLIMFSLGLWCIWYMIDSIGKDKGENENVYCPTCSTFLDSPCQHRFRDVRFSNEDYLE